jgi:hypothetical protein
MKICFISGCDPFSTYLIHKVHEHQRLAAIVRVVGSRQSALLRLKRLRRAPLRTLKSFASRGFYRPRLDRNIDRLGSCRLFGSPTPPALDDCNCLDVPACSLNSPSTIELLQSLAVDLLLVSNTPILRPEIYSSARVAAVNVHWGVAPAFRGLDSLFWAMYFRDYRNLGVTLHYIDEGIDTGCVLAHGFPALSEHESEASLYSKCAQMAAELLLEFLSVADRQPGGRRLDGPSRLFLARDRRIWHDARLWFQQRILHRPVPTRSSTRSLYF